MYHLSWYHGADRAAPHRGYRELQDDDSLTIGREEGVDVLLKDKSVSRLHAELVVSRQGVEIRDRGSSNGVRVDGRRVAAAHWLPGQKLAIGPYTFELAPAPGAAPDVELPSQLVSQLEPKRAPGGRGRITLGEIFVRARNNDKEAVRTLFSGFLGYSEKVIDCGYLGALGFIFPEYSFWCVTNSRVCGLLINRGGWMSFNFGFIRSLNRAQFVQPSMVMLWISIVGWLLFWISFAAALGYAAALWPSRLGWLLGLVVFAVVTALAIRSVPWVVRAYYRWFKAGCVFWTRERVPIVIPSDRHSLQDAQRFIRVYTDQKSQLEP